MNLNRRLFLKHGGIVMAAWGAGAFWADGFLGRAVMAGESNSARRSKRILVCIFQRGAADGLSMVVPYGDPFYYKHRLDIALPRPSRDSEGTAIDLDGFFALHPAMAAFAPLYKAGHLAVIHACGSPSSSRSHFDMQDFLEAGVADDKSVTGGWMNRMLTAAGETREKASPFRAVAMGSVLPRTLQGNADALALRDLSTFGVQAGGSGKTNVASGFEGMYDGAVGDVLGGAGRESFDAISILKKADPAKYAPAKNAKYPPGDFARAMTQVAQLIKADVGLEAAFVEIDGWDTHVNQGAAGGQLAGRLNDFSRAIAAFHNDLGDKFEDVLLLTMTEFGRAARQNGNRGTDHGHGACFFALGGNVRGGKVLGPWPGLAPDQLFEGRDLAVTTDYRSVLAEACVRYFGIPVDAMNSVLPHYQLQPDKFRGFCAA
jgi:uncharacterized protein (DUF1501 family)